MRGIAVLALLVFLFAPTAQAVGLVNAEIAPRGELAHAEYDAFGRSRALVVESPTSVTIPVKLAHASLDGQHVSMTGPARTGAAMEFDDVDASNPKTLSPKGAVAGGIFNVSAKSEGSSLVRAATARLEARDDARLSPRATHTPTTPSDPAAPMPQAGDAPGARPNAGQGIAIQRDSVTQTQSTTIPRPLAGASATQTAWRAAAYAAALLALLAPIALYHRLRGAQALESAQRSKLVELVRASPGMTLSDAARGLNIHPTSARYHLRRLVKENILVVEDGVNYFVAGSVPRAQRAGVAASEGREEVLAAIRASPGLTVTDLARVIGVGRSTMRWHVAKLAQAGLVALARDGRGVRVRPEGFE